jgi:tRNA G18 (ribose-2'-O)-methylase SpoU
MADRWLDPMADVLQAVGAGDFGAVPVYVGDPGLLKSITGFHLHRGAIAAMHRPSLATVGEVVAGAARVAILEDIVDHTNVGAIFRSAAALGADAVLVSPQCADPLYRRSVRVSMGTVFQVPWTRLEPWPQGLHELRSAGFTIVAMDPAPGAVDLDDSALRLPERIALVFGTEGAGLSPAARQAVDLSVRIPMSGGVDSLNVAASSAVALWAMRQ